MDDALAQFTAEDDGVEKNMVLILVVMDDALALNADFEGNVYFIVLILVVMDDALAQKEKKSKKKIQKQS